MKKKVVRILWAVFALIMAPVSVPVMTVIDAWNWHCKPIYFKGFKGCPFWFNIEVLVHNIKGDYN